MRAKIKGFGQRAIAVKVRKSNASNNYLIMVEKIVADSAIDRREANAIKEWLEAELKHRPYRGRLCGEEFSGWVNESPRLRDYPTSTSEIQVFNPKTNLFEVALVTVSGDNIVESMLTDHGTWINPNTVLCTPEVA